MTALPLRRFPETITRRRQGPGDYNNYGEFEEGPVVETDFRASVQPLNLGDDDLEGGSQLVVRLKAYVPVEDALVAAFDDRGADKVLYAGAEFTVIESRSWPGSHTRATLLREV